MISVIVTVCPFFLQPFFVGAAVETDNTFLCISFHFI